MLINWDINNGRLYVHSEFYMLDTTFQKTAEEKQITITNNNKP